MKRQIKDKKGFTLMEMLIVVAIIAVLVAIAIPTVTGQLHNAKVAADMANVRAYYAELQLDYLTRGECLPEGNGIGQVPYWSGRTPYDYSLITFPISGQQVRLQAGRYSVGYLDLANETGGYSVTYQCASSCYEKHTLVLS